MASDPSRIRDEIERTSAQLRAEQVANDRAIILASAAAVTFSATLVSAIMPRPLIWTVPMLLLAWASLCTALCLSLLEIDQRLRAAHMVLMSRQVAFEKVFAAAREPESKDGMGIESADDRSSREPESSDGMRIESADDRSSRAHLYFVIGICALGLFAFTNILFR